MASFHKEDNGTYTIRYRQKDTNGIIHNKKKCGFKKQSEAKQYYEIYISPALSNLLTVSITLNSIYSAFLNYKHTQTKESSYLTIKQICDSFIIPDFGKKNIHEIKSAELIRWQNELDTKKEHYSYAYKGKIRQVFHNLLEFAVNNYGLKVNPFTNIKGFLNKEPKKEMLFWTQPEFEQFINVIDDIVYKNFFLTLYLTGCRKGEAIALNWNDINFNKNIIKINKTFTRKIDKEIKGYSAYKLTSPKTENSNREILLPDVLVGSLKEYKESCKKFSNFSEKWFVFGNDSPLSERAIDLRKNKYCKTAKVKQITIHDFRHSHASLLINNGQNILTVADRLGHSNIKQTLNTYTHLFPNQQQDLLTSLNIKLDSKK